MIFAPEIATSSTGKNVTENYGLNTGFKIMTLNDFNSMSYITVSETKVSQL